MKRSSIDKEAAELRKKIAAMAPHPQLAGLRAALDIVEARKKQLDEKLSMSFESNELGRIAAMLKYEILVLTKTGEPLKSANVRKAGATRPAKT
jgi:hypothetical protein